MYSAWFGSGVRCGIAGSMLLLAIVSMFPATSADAEEGQKFTQLFNGKDLSGWTARPHYDPRKLAAMSEEDRAKQLADWMEEAKAHWTVDDGELVNDGKGPYLTSDRDYGDIELWIDYKTVAKADSGIYLRGTPQVQIWDYTKEGGKWDRGANKGSGGLFNNTRTAPGRDPLVLADKPFGEWNTFRIVQVGARTSVWLNDKLVVDHAIMENFWDRSKPLPAQGPIQLQTHGGEIRWRNLKVREIGPEEANQILASHQNAGFQPIFNGKDFAGWQGDTNNYAVQDGAIVCQPGHGGNVFTKKEYGDFAVRMEFQLPPGGNNGLAIRYPGEGRPHLDGMCELQVLDNKAEKYAKLDPRQYHGSAYGMVAAERGYLRPAGTWNFQEVTVRGSQIQVELNGTPILNADLSKVTEFKDGSAHPGKDRPRGYFGFAGHNDPVKFRKIGLRELE